MSFRGLASEKDRQNVIAYLARFSGGNLAAKVTKDLKFHKIFSRSRVTLNTENIYPVNVQPVTKTVVQMMAFLVSLVGRPKTSVTAMHAYREKHRENPVMQMITGRLADDEIAALAAYFKTIK